ncbi:hypothetical protein A3H89_05370 [Candidatus Amesbacteria bacterium RIFCSPLOWO2_02_FULL_48_11]|uniref:Uncharacterized protein n=5 Tax=Candidatus Amesiibacteriota TaxID=1752730 RepID=A0A1F4Z891_9BACT|nr:MAG: hypothetical protein UX78_C0002G0010 [Candidatus Amesbacteria bacterium GW2011_GWA2_47_11]KKU94613.1 MAG: hypothetical protein UY22_C0011G0020 [Candidatus Amesbacteria bacterium GW2011_GWC1_48_10]KKU98870.1 MAG: hypothetical protein UY33_C0043G0014 [Candidatus Amesbacteria bacterium GW2011_GWA1_48_9]OGD01602.1 MAG: hypothetical protein A2354_04245 [Candidatus Amesbacteria bacterium RIFOXYB1_FULL_47_12]OGD02197.1 MAG: hypothetical protein A3E17_00695 [Candidatus Amesbacteria bacterium RI
MTSHDLVLNIAVNLGRLGRWSHEGKYARIPQFLADTQKYLDRLHNFNPQFNPTYQRFLKDYARLQSTPPNNQDWCDTAFTWAAILTHRAQLA